MTCLFFFSPSNGHIKGAAEYAIPQLCSFVLWHSKVCFSNLNPGLATLGKRGSAKICERYQSSSTSEEETFIHLLLISYIAQ